MGAAKDGALQRAPEDSVLWQATERGPSMNPGRHRRSSLHTAVVDGEGDTKP